MIDILEAWSVKSKNLDTQLSVPIIKELHKKVAWDGNTALDDIISEFYELKEKVPDFFHQFNYEWMFEKRSYDFPQEALYQLFVIEALLGMWSFSDEEKKIREEFSGVSSRLTLGWGLSSGCPRVIPAAENYRFIAIPYAWWDMSWMCLSGLLADNKDTLTIDTFEFDNGMLEEIPEFYPYWDSLLVKALCGILKCPDIIQAEFVKLLSDRVGGLLHLEAFSSMTSVDHLNVFSQRFAMAHEVGHHVESVFEAKEGINTELVADSLAIYGLEQRNWEEAGSDYAPLIFNTKFIPQLGGINFYFILSMWTYSMRAAELAKDNHSERHSKRWELMEERLALWSDAMSKKNQVILGKFPSQDDLVTINGLSNFWDYSMAHAKCYSNYAEHKLSIIYPEAKEIVDCLRSKNPYVFEPEKVDSELTKVLGNDLDRAIEILFSRKGKVK